MMLHSKSSCQAATCAMHRMLTNTNHVGMTGALSEGLQNKLCPLHAAHDVPTRTNAHGQCPGPCLQFPQLDDLKEGTQTQSATHRAADELRVDGLRSLLAGVLQLRVPASCRRKHGHGGGRHPLRHIPDIAVVGRSECARLLRDGLPGAGCWHCSLCTPLAEAIRRCTTQPHDIAEQAHESCWHGQSRDGQAVHRAANAVLKPQPPIQGSSRKLFEQVLHCPIRMSYT